MSSFSSLTGRIKVSVVLTSPSIMNDADRVAVYTQWSILVKLKTHTGERFSFVDRKHWKCFLFVSSFPFAGDNYLSGVPSLQLGEDELSSSGTKIQISLVIQPNLMKLRMRCLPPFIILILPEYSTILYSVNTSIYKAGPSGGWQQLFCLMFNGFLSLWTPSSAYCNEQALEEYYSLTSSIRTLYIHT